MIWHILSYLCWSGITSPLIKCLTEDLFICDCYPTTVSLKPCKAKVLLWKLMFPVFNTLIFIWHLSSTHSEIRHVRVCRHVYMVTRQHLANSQSAGHKLVHAELACPISMLLSSWETMLICTRTDVLPSCPWDGDISSSDWEWSVSEALAWQKKFWNNCLLCK